MGSNYRKSDDLVEDGFYAGLRIFGTTQNYYFVVNEINGKVFSKQTDNTMKLTLHFPTGTMGNIIDDCRSVL